MSLLKASAISKSYAGVQALQSVSFELEPGEVHALIGENGAGKSTLIKILTGAVQPDYGLIEMSGQAVVSNSPHLSRALGISPIYQQPALFPDLTVAENIALTTEPAGLLRRVNWRQRRETCLALLARIGSKIDPDATVSTLNMPEQQVIEIAKALGTEAKVLILDEPTASLSDREVENLFRVIRELRAQGVGLIYVSHRLEELFQIADRVTILRDGCVIATRRIAEVTQSALIELMVGRELSAIFPKREIAFGDVVLEVRGAVSLTVRAGEILGIAGLAGAGRTEFAESLFGLRPSNGSQVFLHGAPVSLSSPAGAVRNGIAYVPEDRRQHGLVMEMSLAENTTLASLDAISHAGLLNFSDERKLATDYKDKLAVKARSIRVPVDHLSGGNQQKVSIARWLATKPSVLILDEPTQGVDVGAKAEIHRIIGGLAEAGLAVIMISSELPELLGMSDRIAVMRRGRIQGVLGRLEATQQKILSLALASTA